MISCDYCYNCHFFVCGTCAVPGQRKMCVLDDSSKLLSKPSPPPPSICSQAPTSVKKVYITHLQGLCHTKKRKFQSKPDKQLSWLPIQYLTCTIKMVPSFSGSVGSQAQARPRKFWIGECPVHLPCWFYYVCLE